MEGGRGEVVGEKEGGWDRNSRNSTREICSGSFSMS